MKSLNKSIFKNLKFSFEDSLLNSKQFLDLSTYYELKIPNIIYKTKSADGTIKVLIEYDKNSIAEAVILPFYNNFNVCLSTQVGCAMKCSFCYTGTQGLKRNLTAGEIIAQYLILRNVIREQNTSYIKKPRIVFMGQGEPLHNFENIKKAISVLVDPLKVDLGPRQITISTSGYLPNLNRFDELYGVNLAISLHSAIDSKRTRLIPINSSYPLNELKQTISKIKLRTQQFIIFEYLLIDNFNMSREDAKAIAEFTKGIPCLMNLIPFNEYPGCDFKRPAMEQVFKFKEYLVSHGLRTMIRATKGHDILAACGQLNSTKF
ncbi:MAG: 23S rRNA (adenine(2503)-C(2))-methyltransferase RlmN [Halobacteriovoraceae bacterium]|nr:23S rRNA (adenine(2503)-C(2))-methyltransferase RlmN [Halobacteriovoraceae bacterium]